MEDNFQMYLQIVSSSAHDQVTKFYCKSDPCYWSLDKNNLTHLFFFMSEGLCTFPVCDVTSSLFDWPFAASLHSLQKRMAYGSWDSWQRAAHFLKKLPSYKKVATKEQALAERGHSDHQ